MIKTGEPKEGLPLRPNYAALLKEEKY